MNYTVYIYLILMGVGRDSVVIVACLLLISFRLWFEVYFNTLTICCVFSSENISSFVVIELNGNLSQMLSLWLCDQIDKHIPLYLRRQAQLKQRPPPVVFELLPSDGILYPGDRTNVQVKFSPAEGVKKHRHYLRLHIY